MNTHTKHNILMLGMGLMLSVLASAITVIPNTASAAANCSTLGVPIMSIAIPGYITCQNSVTERDKVCNISVVSGTVLTATFDNESGGEPYTYVGDNWPNGHSDTHHSPPVVNPAARSHTTDPITSDTSFSLGVDRDCVEDPLPELGGSVDVLVTVIPPLSVGSCSGSPNPATTGSSMTWSVPLPTGGTGSYTYLWSGTDGLGGANRQVNKIYTTTGTKNAQVIVTSGTQTVTKNCSITVNAPSTPTVDLTGPASVAPGQTATLSWTSQNTTSCTATAGAGFATGGATSGSDASSALTTNTTFSISCTGPGGTATDSVTVAVAALTCSGPTTLAPNTNGTFTASGGSGTYAWSTSPAGTPSTGAGTSFATQWGAIGSKTVTVTSDGQTATCPVTVSVSSVSCIGSTAGQTGTSYTFTGSGGTTYTWAVSPTTGFLPSGSTGTGSSVSKTWSTTGTKTITFTSGGQSGVCTISISSSPPPLSVDLRINGGSSATVPYGQSATLTWTSNGATIGCRGSSNPDDAAWPDQSSWVRATSGTQQVLTSAPYVSRTYTIQCTNGASTVTDTVTATVVSAPTCSGPTTLAPNTNGTFTAAGGNGTYTWSTSPAGTPSTGSGSPFTTRWSTTGSKTVTVTSAGLTGTCPVSVGSSLACTPTSPQVIQGDYATFNASGGDGSYTWTGGQIPPTGSGTSFTTQYTTSGTKIVTVSSSGENNTCSVEVVPVPASVCVVDVGTNCGQIVVRSNINTTWNITGPQNFSQSEPGGVTPVVYDARLCGIYTIFPATHETYGVPTISPVSGSGTLGSPAGPLLEFELTYAVPVDLKANGKDGGVEVVQGEKAMLTWTTTDAILPDSCVASSNPASGGWSGQKEDDNTIGEPSAQLNTITTYLFRLTCKNIKDVSVWDEVDVTVIPPQCSDEQYWIDKGDPTRGDNDGDKFYDCDDPGCYPSGGDTCDPLDDSEANVAQCDDGLDNDDDGFTDWDGVDGKDGNEDDDPGCSGPLDNNEENPSTIITQCNDGLDNDGDLDKGGGIDFTSVDGQPVDPDCESALDPSELKDPDIREI